MRVHSCRALVGAICCVVCAGCFSVVTPTAADADRLAADGNLQQADEEYARAMREFITQDEWDYIAKKRCKARTEIVRTALQSGDAKSVEDLRALRALALRCDSYPEFAPQLRERLIAAVEERFTTEVEPMIADRRAFAAFELAASLTPDLAADHPRHAWLEAQRAALADETRALLRGLPVTAGVARSVLRSLGDPDGGELDAEAVRRLTAVQRDEGSAVLADASCGGATTAVYASEATGNPYQLLSVGVRNCEHNVTTRLEVEQYTEIERHTVTREAPVTVRVPTTYTQTSYRQWCTPDGRMQRCHTVADSRRTTTVWSDRIEMREVRETVEVPVQKTREVKRAYAERRADVTFVVVSEHGTREHTMSVVQATPVSDTVPPNTPPEQIVTRGDTGVAYDADFRSLVVERVSAAADSVASAMLAEALRAKAHAAFSQGNDAEGIELALTCSIAFGDLDGELAAATNEAFVGHVAQDPLNVPMIPTYQWASATIAGDPFVFEPEFREFAGVVRYGYPTSLVGFGASYARPESLVAQPTRAALQLDVTSQARYSLTSGEYHRGLGVVGGLGVDVRAGYRFGDDYIPLEEPVAAVEPEAQIPDDPDATSGETKLALSADVSAVAMVGGRTRNIGIFAGLRPQLSVHKVGYFIGERAMLSPTARVELRWVERYPLVLEAWWGNLTDAAHFGELTHAGATLDVPLETNLWFRLAARHYELRANVFGMSKEDPVYVEHARLFSGAASVSYSF